MPTTELKLNPRFVLDRRGRPRDVLLTMKEYRGLLERLEDLADALELDEAVATAGPMEPLEDVLAELKREGLL